MNFDSGLSDIAWSGKGVVQNCDVGGLTIPDLWDRALAMEEEEWNHWSVKPDLVFIYLGVNDFCREPPPLDVFAQRYADLLGNVTRKYGTGVKIFSLCGGFEEMGEYRPCPFVKVCFLCILIEELKHKSRFCRLSFWDGNHVFLARSGGFPEKLPRLTSCSCGN